MVAAVVLGFALFAWVSSADSVPSLQTPRTTATASPPPLPRSTARAQEPTPTRSQTPTPSKSYETHLAWVVSLLTWIMWSGVLIGLALLAAWSWRKRWHRPAPLPRVAFDVLPEVTLALANDERAQFATLQEGSPRNAIVASWMRLEEAVIKAGVPRDPAETSIEFTTRVLGALTVDPALFRGFAGLYREARFSSHEMGEPARRSAVAALGSLNADLAASSGPVPSDVRLEEME